ncbi:MAG: molybdopterin oxidoreductase [Oligoflexia bacterium]|nr:molybdopterin oxidoreductase [Oligoflexia bacterium]
MKTLNVSTKFKNICGAFIAIGVLSFAVAYFRDPNRAWHGYIMNYYFFLCLGLGGCFFSATQHLTNAGWSATVRRIPESFYSWLPAAAILFLPVLFGSSHVYEWLQHHAPHGEGGEHHAQLLHMKQAYLNLPFFIIRVALLFAVWYFVGGKLIRNSLKQDQTGDIELTRQNVKYSAIFIPLFALLFTFVSVDLIMSLDPLWYSTMFGVRCFATLFLTTLAMTNVVLIKMKRLGYFGNTVNENHIQNTGLLMFAFVVFYAYIAFCEFMLIWYANMPEETSYYLKRYEGGWCIVAYSIIFLKFVVPFLGLLPREAKRDANRNIKFAYLILVANWIDIFWMVMPNYSAKPFVPVFEIGIFLGFLGLFGLQVTNFLSRNPIQPQKDPRVHEALHLHQ